MALTGEKITLVDSHSLAWGGSRIVERRWTLPDGSTVTGDQAQASFAQPGVYVATLWIKDNAGNEDVDFCQIKVFSQSKPEANLPHLFLSYTPTAEVHPKTPLSVRLWFQGANSGPIRLEFDDGRRIAGCPQYAEVRHRFDQPGVHILTGTCQTAGHSVTAKLKVIVSPAP